MVLKYTMIGLCAVLTFFECKATPFGDQFQAGHMPFSEVSSSEEMYYHDPQQEDYHPQETYRNIEESHPLEPSLYQPMPISHQQPEIHSFDTFPNDEGVFSDSDTYPYFQPQVRYGTFDNAFKTMIDPMRKQMSEASDAMKGMGENMGKQAEDMGKQAENMQKQFGEAGEQITEEMQKPAEDFSEQMQDGMDDAQKNFEEHVDTMRKGAEEAGTAMPFASASDSKSEGKKKLEGASAKKEGKGDNKELKDPQKKLEDENPMKKMQETGEGMKKAFPVPGSLVSNAKDETTEAHEDDDEFPRAEAMEWGSPDFVDLRQYHPRSRYFDYYHDGGY